MEQQAASPLIERARRYGPALAVAAALVLLVAALLPLVWEPPSPSAVLSRKAKQEWQDGQYQDAARNFMALTEIYPTSPLAEESYYWAAGLYQYFLHNADEAVSAYRQLITRFPDGEYYFDAKKNLAELYSRTPDSRFLALQIYHQLANAPELNEQHEAYQFKLGQLNLDMGRTEAARYEFRAFLRRFPKSPLVPRVYYLVGYSFYLESRPKAALAVMDKTVQDFPGTPEAAQAQYFMADTLEDQGNLLDALKLFQGLKGKYHNEKVVDQRIQALQSRLHRAVR